ncbi:MAG: hydantoinase/oxoprolinase family protein [Burkholderiaceae bacterium]
MRVGVEVGGTFTDLVAIDGDRTRISKVASVPHSPDEGVFAALEAARIDIGAITDLVHGSTVATNAVLERKGVATALITTRGFRDVLLIQRGGRPRIFDIRYQKPSSVVHRKDILEVDERIGADGSVVTPLADEAMQRVEAFLAAGRYESVAICLINAYANPAHEHALGARIRERHPQLFVACSSDISCEFREYERTSTTVLSAYVQPIIDRYLDRMQRNLRERGFRGRLSVMQSNGGRLPAEMMRQNAISALFSGPAAGVTAAAHFAQTLPWKNLITFDMGGTSTDVGMVIDGQPVVAPSTSIDGLPVRTPVIDITSVGAGGGSIVWQDDAGVLQVGPKSSGARPGPACYGRGGTQPTISDAHLVCGTLQPDSFVVDGHALDPARARAAFDPLASALAMTVEETCDSAIRLANANVVRAIQLISTERGYDPRDYVLIPYGGAGPLHAARIAQELGMKRVVVPHSAGVLSAFGLLASNFTQFEAITRKMRVEPGAADRVREVLAGLSNTLTQRFRDFGLHGRIGFDHTLQMRFVGQAFELDVPLGADLDELDDEGLRRRFIDVHCRTYFQTPESLRDKAVEVVAFRVGASVPQEPPEHRPDTPDDTPGEAQAELYENGQRIRCRVLHSGSIAARRPEPGPLLVRDASCALYVPAGWTLQGDESGNLVLEMNPV